MYRNENILAAIFDNVKQQCLLIPPVHSKESFYHDFKKSFFSKIRKALLICTTNDHHIKIVWHSLKWHLNNSAECDLLVNATKTVPDRSNFSKVLTFEDKFEPSGKDSTLVKTFKSKNYDVIFFTCNEIIGQTYFLRIDKSIPDYRNISNLMSLMPKTGFVGIDGNFMSWLCHQSQRYNFIYRDCIPDIDLSDITVILYPDEIKELYNLTVELKDGSVVVEIGAFKGGSAVVMGMGLKKSGSKNSRLYSIDPCFQPEYYTNITKYGLNDIVVPLKMESKQAALSWPKKLKNAEPKNIDLLFIDGCHWFDMVKQDIFLWEKFLKPGSIIAIHDYAFRADHYNFDVAKATYELIQMREGYEFMELVESMLIAKKL